MTFSTRKLVTPQDLNHHNTVFGGRLLAWIDEECYIYAVSQLQTPLIVTKYMGDINFISTAEKGDVIEINVETVRIGTTSLTMRCELRNKTNQQSIVCAEKVVFVSIDEQGNTIPHALAAQSSTRP